jgi:hypothetical protein
VGARLTGQGSANRGSATKPTRILVVRTTRYAAGVASLRVSFLALALALVGCDHRDPPRSGVPPKEVAVPEPTPALITDRSQLRDHLDQLVTLRGELTRTKIPTILGVDVDEGTATPGALAEATGVLRGDRVTQEEIDERIRQSGQFAHRGAGTFYKLVRPSGGGLAAARPQDAR